MAFLLINVFYVRLNLVKHCYSKYIFKIAYDYSTVFGVKYIQETIFRERITIAFYHNVTDFLDTTEGIRTSDFRFQNVSRNLRRKALSRKGIII